MIESERIIQHLNANYSIKVVTLTPLSVGADINASIYKAQSHDQTNYFIKLKRGHHDASIEVLKLLWDAGIQQIIPPINTIDGKITQRIDDLTLIVYPFIEGEDGFNRDLAREQWIGLGKALRQVHELQIPHPVLNHIRNETFSKKWRDIVRSLYTHFEGDEIPLQLQKFMKEKMSDIRRLVDRAEELGEKLQNSSLNYVLCHSDIHGGNVLMDENSHLYIVDWDEPIMAPKERDLMFIGGSVGNVWNKPHEEKLFFEGYGKTDVHSTALAYYRHERIVEDIATYSQELLLTTAGDASRQEMYQHFLAMFEPQGVVDVAFKTDESLS